MPSRFYHLNQICDQNFWPTPRNESKRVTVPHALVNELRNKWRHTHSDNTFEAFPALPNLFFRFLANRDQTLRETYPAPGTHRAINNSNAEKTEENLIHRRPEKLSEKSFCAQDGPTLDRPVHHGPNTTHTRANITWAINWIIYLAGRGGTPRTSSPFQSNPAEPQRNR